MISLLSFSYFPLPTELYLGPQVLFPLSCWGVELLAGGRHRALRWLLAAAPEPRLFLEYHEWLLGDEVDILPFLLLPLAGPEEFPEDEMESKQGSEPEVGWGQGAAGRAPP